MSCVGHRVAISVCVYVCHKSCIVDYGQMVRVFVFCHKIEKVGIVLRILNIEGHQNCMISTQVTNILMMFFVIDY